MTRSQTMPVSELAQYVSYQPDTGRCFWVRRMRYGIEAGTPIDGLNSYGYVQACIQRRPYLGHRIGWALVHGEWPDKMVDHINGIRHDNRLTNLRLATSAQNQANRSARKDSLTGLRGVRFDKKTGKYGAQIQLGGFSTAEEAHAAFMRLSKFCYGEFAPTELLGSKY